jgi:hypothetical protein
MFGCATADDDSDFFSKLRVLREELTTVQAAMKQAVQDKNYTAAAEHQVKEAELTTSLAELKRSRRETCGGAGLPSSSDSMQVVAMRVWQERLDMLLGPLDSAINTTLAILQQGLVLAAAEGSMRIAIVPSALAQCNQQCEQNYQQHQAHHQAQYGYDYQGQQYQQQRTQCTQRCSTASNLPVEYIVDIGSCKIPIGRKLTEAGATQYRSSGRAQGKANDIGSCSEEQLLQYVEAFDADTLHSFEDLQRVQLSEVARLNLRWRLHEAGYTTTPIQPWNSYMPGTVQEGQPWLQVGYGPGNVQEGQPHGHWSDTFVEYVVALKGGANLGVLA